MDDLSEIFDVVDERDRVVGQATRGEVHRKGLLHRSVHILLFNSKGQLFLQKRSMEKDENPGYWDTSSAGHLNAGEGYLDAAHRELMEELGVDAELEELYAFRASPETFWEHVRVYRGSTDSPITIHPGEISEGRFWSLSEIRCALANGSILFTSTFRLIMERFHSRLPMEDAN